MNPIRRLLDVRLGSLLKLSLIGVGSVVLLAAAAFVLFIAYPHHNVPVAEVVDRYVYLDQGWGDEAGSARRQTYYYTGQGTSLPQGNAQHPLRYDWFVHLEMPLGTDRFADPDHLRAYRFIVDPTPTPANPDQLPVGFARHYSPVVQDDVLDITCAACHTGQLHYEKDGTQYAVRVDGGQAMHAFADVSRGSFDTTLLASLAATYANPLKFDRFARKVLDDPDTRSKSALRDELGATLRAFVAMGQNNPFRHLYPTQEGYGRTDALGRIANTVFGDHLVPANYHVAAAPVSYPYVWNIWKFDWVQYNGSVSQPLARNIGEALGVGAVIDLVDAEGRPLPTDRRYVSSVKIPELVTIEHTLQTLQPPSWPSELFGEVDTRRAEQGRELFETHCQGCHGPHAVDPLRQAALAPGKHAPGTEWHIEVIPVEHIGTDPGAALGFVERRYDLTATGLTNEDVQGVLRPVRTQQIARDLTYHVKSLLADGGDHADLRNLLARLPANDPDPRFDSSVLAGLAAYAEGLIGTQSGLSVHDRPAESETCDHHCHARWLLWQARYAIPAMEAELAAVDVSQVSEGEGLNIIGLFIKNRFYQDNGIEFEQQQCLEGFGTLDLPQQIAGYKPRPLEGVWATPPFLHNGSVPSIYQLLSAPEDREARFLVGTRNFDPTRLGYETGSLEGDGFVFDTSLAGNGNGGHAFAADAGQWARFKSDPTAHPLPPGVIGPAFSDAERYAIIEYLKVHRDEPTTPGSFTPSSCFDIRSAAR